MRLWYKVHSSARNDDRGQYCFYAQSLHRKDNFLVQCLTSKFAVRPSTSKERLNKRSKFEVSRAA
jgi:hypothetical protein